MKESKTKESEKKQVVSGNLSVEVVAAEEAVWFDEQLGEHHYLGAGCPVGDYLRQVVRRRGSCSPVSIQIKIALTSANPSSTIRLNASASSHDLKTKDHGIQPMPQDPSGPQIRKAPACLTDTRISGILPI